MEGIVAMGFEAPTSIQRDAIPVILKGGDLIGCAQTGTGKTAAFVLPLLQKILKEPDRKGTYCMIIVPTRELALQIDQQLQGFAYFLPFSSIAVYGGGSGNVWEAQKNALEKGVDIVIATPGRLIAHLAVGNVDSGNMKMLVLDEADRMLDMGFYDDIMHIVDSVPKQRQTLMFSATMPPRIRELAKKILKNPEEINIGLAKPPEGVLQAAYLVCNEHKRELMRELLKGKEDLKSILIFSSTKKSVREIASELKSHGFKVEAMHSDLQQNEREEALNRFKNRKVQILIATDIVSRGIDIEAIDLVINYNVPADAEDYVHRVGRTARAEQSGVALTFIDPSEKQKFKNIERFIENEIYKAPLPDHLEEVNRSSGKKKAAPKKSSIASRSNRDQKKGR